ncbi:hypothetical protein TDB9533_02956 [Thalassocella blandensis]|nr:hypothetical protein TDB9533_02956 [Thalassocella blandensis]
MYYGETGKQITKAVMVKALSKLGDLLKAKKQRLELVCCGGIVSVLYHGSRQMTHDVDVLFPNNPTVAKLLKELVDQVGAEFGLEHGPRDKWFNDSVSFIGLQSKSNTVVFRHSNLILKAADWHEMLAHKVTAFRGARDINDAVHFLKEIKSKDKHAIFEKVKKFKPFVPHVADKLFESRFEQIWEKAYGKS